jgi:hypothetical protein
LTRLFRGWPSFPSFSVILLTHFDPIILLLNTFLDLLLGDFLSFVGLILAGNLFLHLNLSITLVSLFLLDFLLDCALTLFSMLLQSLLLALALVVVEALVVVVLGFAFACSRGLWIAGGMPGVATVAVGS